MYEKELMEMVLAVQKWRHYLIGRRFVIWTDQHSIRFISQQREIGCEYQRWVTKLLGYDFEICYRPGITNKVADALSRQPTGSVIFGAMISTCEVNWAALNREINKDPFLLSIRHGIATGEGSFPGYHVENERLLYKGHVVIPP